MNYELAKELYLAGFPYVMSRPTKIPEITAETREITFTEYFDYPILEELIEAFNGRTVNIRTDNLVTAAWLSQREYASIAVQSSSTPTEAVARLWLALNQK